MAVDARQIEVPFVARLVDELDSIGEVFVAGAGRVALSLVPVLKRRRDEVDVEPCFGKRLRYEPETRVAARFVAELDALRDDGDALSTRRPGF